MDHLLRQPDRALTQALQAQNDSLMRLASRSFGSGAIREVRDTSNTTVATDAAATILSASCDPGDWLLIYGCVARVNVPIGATGNLTVWLSDIANSARTSIRYYPGDAAEQILGVLNVSFSAITNLNVQFGWFHSIGGSANATCFHRQITMVPL